MKSFASLPEHRIGPWTTVISYMGAVIIIQRQRLCVALNVTIEELRRSQSWCQGMAVMRVNKHKTGSRTDPAAFVLRRQHEVFYGTQKSGRECFPMVPLTCYWGSEFAE